MLTKGIGFSLSYQQLRSNASASFTDGSTREFQLDVFTPINGGFLFRVKRFDIQPRLGFCEAYMRTWTEYEDGTVSFGNERALNGTYRTFGLFAGLDLAMRIKLSETMQLERRCGLVRRERIGVHRTEHRAARGYRTRIPDLHPYRLGALAGLACCERPAQLRCGRVCRLQGQLVLCLREPDGGPEMRTLLLLFLCVAAAACQKEDRLREKYSGLYTVNSQERTWYAPDSTVTFEDCGTLGLYDNDNNPFNNVVHVLGTLAGELGQQPGGRLLPR
ncbi:MAG: hypothetical protein IPG92_08595 [Flavobacteriales bacterium]|nr:hypothetical protein [Flavobacteriales bacterium]